MFEIFFILIIVYIAYVIYSGVDDNKHINIPVNAVRVSSNNPAVSINSQNKAAKKSTATPRKVVTEVKPDTAKVESTKPAKSKVKKTAAPKIELRTVTMKNPKTDEQAKIANNYRMVKRWVKEALVEEGLLEKIYKTNEMDDAAKIKVAKALSIIKAMDKYKYPNKR